MDLEEEEVELIKFKSKQRTVAEFTQLYGEILSDHVECGHTHDYYPGSFRDPGYVKGCLWPLFDEIVRASWKKWEGQVRIYKTDADGKRTLGFACRAETFMNYRVVIPDDKTTKLDYEFDIRITKRPLEKICYDGKFEKSDENDTAIEIENKLVFVNKQLLIDNSDYFRCLFSSEFCDSAQPIIRIGLSTFDEFCLLLSTFHPPHEVEILDQQVEQLLELAERFQLKTATEKIRLHLLQNTSIPYNKQLWLAEKYKLEGVIDDVLTALNESWKQYKKILKHRRFYDQLSEETKRKLELNK